MLASVRKTGRALVLHEAPLTGGFGAEIAAAIGASAFDVAGRAGRRASAGLDMPVPFSKALEAIYSPHARLLPAIRDVLAELQRPLRTPDPTDERRQRRI